jgi:hypothetical protein
VHGIYMLIIRWKVEIAVMKKGKYAPPNHNLFCFHP